MTPKKKLHKILLICLISLLSTIILVNAVLLYLFIPITPKSNDSLWNTEKYSNLFFNWQTTRQELFAMRRPFSKYNYVLYIEIRLDHRIIDTAKPPVLEDHETLEEQMEFQEKYDREMTIYKEEIAAKRRETYKSFLQTYELDALPFYYQFNCEPDNNAKIYLYIPGTITISTYRKYVEKLEATQNDTSVAYVYIGYQEELDYWTKKYLPGETLFE